MFVMYLRSHLTGHHLSENSKDVIKLGMGLIATMTALVLGLLIATAKSSFGTQNEAIKHSAAKILLLDHMLSAYGPETRETRELLRRIVTTRVNAVWPEDRSQSVKLDAPETMVATQGIESGILHLSPKNDAQRWLQTRALEIGSQVGNGFMVPRLFSIQYEPAGCP